MFCVVKDNIPYYGSKQEIVNQICNFWFEKRKLRIQFKGYGTLTHTYHSYTDEWTEEEREKDAIKFIWKNLTLMGFLLFKSI